MARAHRRSASTEPCSYSIENTRVTPTPSPASQAAVSKVAAEVLSCRK